MVDSSIHFYENNMISVHSGHILILLARRFYNLPRNSTVYQPQQEAGFKLLLSLRSFHSPNLN